VPWILLLVPAPVLLVGRQTTQNAGVFALGLFLQQRARASRIELHYGVHERYIWLKARTDRPLMCPFEVAEAQNDQVNSVRCNRRANKITGIQEAFVLKFLGDWAKGDPQHLASHFTEDAFYTNIPSPSARGKKAIEEMIAGFFAMASFRIDTLSIISRGNMVWTERIDYMTFPDKSKGTLGLPVAGIMELENGKIKEWREYLDLGTVEEATGIKMR
jgi:limonene-1,2-epoxide hydrolase